MPSCNTSRLTWASLTLDVGYLFTAAPAKLLLALDEGYLLTAALPDLERGVAPLSPPAPRSSRSLELGLLLLAAAPVLDAFVSKCENPAVPEKPHLRKHRHQGKDGSNKAASGCALTLGPAGSAASAGGQLASSSFWGTSDSSYETTHR